MESSDENLNRFPAPSLRDAEIITLIERLQDAEDWEIRAAAAKELGQRGEPRAVEPLCLALRDKIWQVRIAAVGSLGRLKDPQSVEPLCDNLQDTDWYIRMAVLVALREIGDLRAVEPLCSALEDTEAAVRSCAAEALGQLGDVWAVDALCRALKDQDQSVRLSAGGALDRMGTAETLPLRALAAMTIPPSKMADTLQALSDAAPRIMVSGAKLRGRPRPSHYPIGNVQAFCENLSRHTETNESVRRGAKAVLAELHKRADAGVLLRASTRSDLREKEELLRGISGLPDSSPPNELLRASDTFSKAPTDKTSLLARIFKMKRSR